MMSKDVPQSEKSTLPKKGHAAEGSEKKNGGTVMMHGRQLFPVVTHAFLNRVRTQPSKQIFHFKEGADWKSLTWKEFFENARLVSMGLTALGVKKGDRVCILSNTRLEWSLTDMAILGANAITVPIYASNTAEDCEYILNHCEAEILFVEDQKQVEKILSIRDKLPKIKKIIVFSFSGNATTAAAKEVLSFTALVDMGKKALSGKEEVFEKNLTALTPSDVFTICYTSGTTGVPKGAVLTFDSLASILEDVEKVLGHAVGEKDTLLSFLPASHIFGKIECMAGYQFGWKIYYAESIEKLFLNINDVRPTLLFAVPRIFEKAYVKIKASVDDSSATKKALFDWAFKVGREYYEPIWQGKSPSAIAKVKYAVAEALVFKKVYAKFGGRLRICVAGGAPLPKEIGQFMRIVGIRILEGYGLTETCAPVAVNSYENPKFGTIGKPLPEVSVKIDKDGELLVKSRKVFREYYKNPEATAEVIDKEGWFHTGDIGVIDPDGYLRITDRKKDLIVTSGGKNVAPQKIENLAKSHKYVSQFMVYGDKRNYLTALVVLDREETIKFAKEKNILFSDYNELVKNPKITQLVQSILDKVNAHLASFESVKRFKILPNDFTVETGEITPSLKLRRRFCNEKYKDELESMYH